MKNIIELLSDSKKNFYETLFIVIIIYGSFYLVSTINIWIVYYITIVPFLILDTWKKRLKLLSIAKKVIAITIIYNAYKYLGLLWGTIGIIITFSLYVIYFLWNIRKQLLGGMRSIETRMFGKPLDKQNWIKPKEEEKQ